MAREFFDGYDPAGAAPGGAAAGSPSSSNGSSGSRGAPAAKESEPAGSGSEGSASEGSAKKEPAKEEPAKRESASKGSASGGTSSKDPSKDEAEDAQDAQDAREDETTPLKGFAGKVVQNMEASLEVPTATSVRAVPAKLLIDNRTVINRHLARSQGGKISFTHLIGYAVVRAASAMPEMNVHFDEVDGKPAMVRPADVNLGIAIDLAKDDGSRQLVVPSVKGSQDMDFEGFWGAYEDLVRKARGGGLTIDDHMGATLSLTNPGGIGTVHSVPRLMKGQSTIIGVGALEYPAEFQGASPETLARLGISKILTLTSTYDHPRGPGGAVRRVPEGRARPAAG